MPATTIATIKRAKLPTVDQSINPNAARNTKRIKIVTKQPPNPPLELDINFDFNIKKKLRYRVNKIFKYWY